MKGKDKVPGMTRKLAPLALLIAGFLLVASLCFGAPERRAQIPNIFRPESTPADSLFRLPLLVLAAAGHIFLMRFCLLVDTVVKSGRRGADDGCEPPQVYGSNH